jgi:hypothetical protein
MIPSFKYGFSYKNNRIVKLKGRDHKGMRSSNLGYCEAPYKIEHIPPKDLKNTKLIIKS